MMRLLALVGQGWVIGTIAWFVDIVLQVALTDSGRAGVWAAVSVVITCAWSSAWFWRD